MSTTHHAAAIVGCRIPLSKLFVTNTIRSCGHPTPIGNAQFCPDCGKKLWQEVKQPISQYDHDASSLCGYRVFAFTVDSDYVYISDLFSEVKNEHYEKPRPITIDQIPPIKIRIRAILGDIGLWNEDEFGIWPVLRYS